MLPFFASSLPATRTPSTTFQHEAGVGVFQPVRSLPLKIGGNSSDDCAKAAAAERMKGVRKRGIIAKEVLGEIEMIERLNAGTGECKLRCVSDITKCLPAIRRRIISACRTVAEQLEESVSCLAFS